MPPSLRFFFTAAFITLAAPLTSAQPQLENLGRGVVAIHQPDGKVAVSWRLLGTDPEGVAFNLYRQSEPPPGGFGGRGGGGGRGGPPAVPGNTATRECRRGRALTR